MDTQERAHMIADVAAILAKYPTIDIIRSMEHIVASYKEIDLENFFKAVIAKMSVGDVLQYMIKQCDNRTDQISKSSEKLIIHAKNTTAINKWRDLHIEVSNILNLTLMELSSAVPKIHNLRLNG